MSRIFILFALALSVFVARAEMISIVIASNAAPRVEFGAEKILEALKAVKLDAAIVPSSAGKISAVVTGASSEQAAGRRIYLARLKTGGKSESFTFAPFMVGSNETIIADDDSGLLYGCLELAKRIRAAGTVPND